MPTPAAARLPRADDVNIGAGFDPWGYQRPLKWQDTTSLVKEERDMIDYVRERGSAKLWTMLGELSKSEGRKHKYQSRSHRQKLIAVFTRLTKEEKLVRDRTTNLVRLGLALSPVRVSEEQSRLRTRLSAPCSR